MKRILITQRLDKVSDREEYRDALDVNLVPIFWSLGFLPILLASGIENPSDYISELRPEGFLLSGGNTIGDAHKRDQLEYAVLDFAEMHQLPVLGVCRGLQMINVRQGGKLSEVKGHVATRHLVTDQLTGRRRLVNSYHNYGIEPQYVGRDLEVLATSHDGYIESLRHKHLPWLAIMWHPEREKVIDEADKQLIIKHFKNTD